MKLLSFISRLQELNVYLSDFPPAKESQETAPLSADEIMDIIYHSIPTMWKNKMIKQGFNDADCTTKEMNDFFETGVEKLEPKEEKKESSAAAKKPKDKKSTGKWKQEDSDSSVVKSSEDSSVEGLPKMNPT